MKRTDCGTDVGSAVWTAGLRRKLPGAQHEQRGRVKGLSFR